MLQRLAYYLEQRDLALKQSADSAVDGEAWLKLAEEWQKLHDALARDLGELPRDKPQAHVLDT